MTRAKLLARLEVAEAKAKARRGQRVTRSDMRGLLFAVLSVVGEEAGPEVGGSVARRVVEGKAADLITLLAGMTSRQLAEVARRTGEPVEDLACLTAPELLRLYFGRAS